MTGADTGEGRRMAMMRVRREAHRGLDSWMKVATRQGCMLVVD